MLGFEALEEGREGDKVEGQVEDGFVEKRVGVQSVYCEVLAGGMALKLSTEGCSHTCAKVDFLWDESSPLFQAWIEEMGDIEGNDDGQQSSCC